MVGSFAGAAVSLIVAPVFHLAHVFPVKDNAVGRKDFEVAGNETGFRESFAGDLSLPAAGGNVSPPSYFTGRHVFVAGDLGGNPLSLIEINLDDLLKVAVVIADPLAFETDGWRGKGGHRRTVGRRRSVATKGTLSGKPAKKGDGFAGDRIGDMEDRKWSVFKLKSKFEGLNLRP